MIVCNGIEYRGDRCAFCAERHYRISGACEKCPDSFLFLVLLFLIAISALGYTLYKLQKNDINVAGLSIGMDFFQVTELVDRFDSIIFTLT